MLILRIDTKSENQEITQRDLVIFNPTQAHIGCNVKTFMVSTNIQSIGNETDADGYDLLHSISFTVDTYLGAGTSSRYRHTYKKKSVDAKKLNFLMGLIERVGVVKIHLDNPKDLYNWLTNTGEVADDVEFFYMLDHGRVAMLLNKAYQEAIDNGL